MKIWRYFIHNNNNDDSNIDNVNNIIHDIINNNIYKNPRTPCPIKNNWSQECLEKNPQTCGYHALNQQWLSKNMVACQSCKLKWKLLPVTNFILFPFI